MTIQDEFNSATNDYYSKATNLANFLQTITLSDLTNDNSFRKLEELRYEVIEAHLVLAKFITNYKHHSSTNNR